MDDTTRDGSSRRGSEFERGAYEFARLWATGVDRRGLLKAFGAGGAAAAAAMLGGMAPAPTSAAPRQGASVTRRAAQDGSLVRIARGQESDTLDPQKTALLVAHEVCWQIYDSLIYLDEAGTVHPGLATEWAFSDDNLTLTFSLREGVTFHDGTPFDADAVKATVDRHRDPATASPTAYMLGPLDTVEVIDPLTVAYKYTEPFLPLFVGLGYSYCAPISPTAAQAAGDDFGRNPVGAGPYKFVSWDAAGTITLEKNPEHAWATSFYQVEGGPTIDRAEFVVIPEDATRLAALISGEIDVIAGTDAVPVDKIRALENEPGLKVYTRDAVGVYYNFLNTTMAPFDDVRVRQAVNYAVDKEKLIALVLDGQGKPAVSPLASAFGDFNPDVTKYPYDPQQAKALLAEAGFADGFETLFLTINSPVYQRTAEVVQEDLAQVGITVNIEAYPVAELFTKGPEKQWGMMFFYYTYSDPDVLYLLCSSKGSISWSFQTDPELDEWLDQQRVEFDREARKELLYQAQARVADAALWLFLWEGVYAAAMAEKVQGLEIDLVGFVHLQEMTLSE